MAETRFRMPTTTLPDDMDHRNVLIADLREQVQLLEECLDMSDGIRADLRRGHELQMKAQEIQFVTDKRRKRALANVIH